MGCWNETCGISQLPIHAGDKICCFVLGPSIGDGDINRTYYPDDAFIQLGFPILGEYDDYGGIEKVVPNESMELYLKNVLEVFSYNENTDSFVKVPWVTMESFLEELTRYRLYVKVPRYRRVGGIFKADSEYTKLNFMLMHQDLYELLLDEVKERVPYSYNESYETLVKRKIKDKIKEYKNHKDTPSCFGAPISKSFYDFYVYSTDTHWKSLDYFVDLVQPGYHLNDTIVDGIADYIFWYNCMSLMRKGFHVYSGTKSRCGI